jgi:Type II CAAX prenyl endopeptidase Rce1-like
MNIFREIKDVLKALLKNETAILLIAIVILLMLYGYHGNMELLKLILPDWSYPGADTGTRKPIISWIPWDREFISFSGGFILLVIIPCLIIRFGLHQNLSGYGLGWPVKSKRRESLVLFLTLALGSAIPFYFGAKNADMQSVYPFYKTFTGLPQFLIYELTYFPFFVVIELVFRGMILFSVIRLLEAKPQDTVSGVLAIAIAMIPYCTWHIGKPATELWGTPVWGLLAGAGIYITRSVWPVLVAHWLLNIWLDGWILHNLGLAPFG